MNNEHVERWVKFFSMKDKVRFNQYLQRGNQYREIVQSILDDNGLPAELYYLAMIESGYHQGATSPAKAAGVWQFMPATARNYGLRVDAYVDERRDPIRSTEAAAKYLRDLYNIFGSWPLAWASYNAGEHRVLRTIVKCKSRDFWELSERKCLPPETRQYVPKLLAAIQVGEDPKTYGLSAPESEKIPSLRAVEVPSLVPLEKIASQLGIHHQSLLRWNPHLRRGITPPGAAVYEIWVSDDRVETLRKATPKLASMRLRAPVERVPVMISAKNPISHRVRPRETLGQIARKHSMTLSHLKSINDLVTDEIRPGMQLRLSTKVFNPNNRKRHMVAQGDTLFSISKKTGIPENTLRHLNSLRGSRIYVGQRLRLQAGS